MYITITITSTAGAFICTLLIAYLVFRIVCLLRGKKYKIMASKNNIEKYIERLKKCQNMDDTECAHADADRVLEDVILNELVDDFKQVVNEYKKVPKWYA